MKPRSWTGWTVLLLIAPLWIITARGQGFGARLPGQSGGGVVRSERAALTRLWFPLRGHFPEWKPLLVSSLGMARDAGIPSYPRQPWGQAANWSGRKSDPPRKPSFLWVHSRKSATHLVEWTIALSPLFALSASSFLDHRYPPNDAQGIWQRSYQLDLEHGVMAIEGAGALWLGGRSRLGRTFWQALDSSLFTAITTTALKYAFSRARPFQSSNPHDFFQGNCCQSFPSGEVAFQASFVTPFIAEYYRQNPWVWGLEVLPLYDALGRMRARGHWQTDVIAGWAIGTAWGIYAHEEKEPFVLGLLPGGFMVGLHESF
jgi:undecaprenyl-diphosphatase